MSKLPLVSIIVPSFNAEVTIRRALNSIVTQNYDNIEIICVDGLSQDNTVDIIREFDSKISKLISEKDRGIADALNKGIRLAKGSYIGWLCADDELAPDALTNFTNVFNEHPEVDVVTGACHRFYADGSELITRPTSGFELNLSMKNGIEQPSTLWKRDLQTKVGLLDESYRMAFDHELWCRFKANGAIFYATDLVLSSYHFSETNVTSVGGRKLVKEMFRVCKKYGPYYGFTAYMYYYLYTKYDLGGFFDSNSDIDEVKRSKFNSRMKMLRNIFGETVVNNYNWNFASKQERGLCWYK
jgi:glycosyltransferase involved in cell wall biosynthesis